MPITSTEASAPSDQTTASIDVGSIRVPAKTAEIIPHPAAKAVLDAKAITVPGPSKGGKGGKEVTESTAFTASTPTNAAFLAILFAGLPEGARPVVTAKAGDPEEGGWPPSDADKVDAVCSESLNTYFNCASFHLTGEGSLAARKEHAAAYHVLVLDDVGTKVDRALLGKLTPTWELETSPGNFQIGFKLSLSIADPAEVDRFQHRIADAGLTDKGALGMARWARLPVGINGKPKYQVDGKPFTCRLHTWNPSVAYTVEQLLEALAPTAGKPTEVSAPTRERSTQRPSENGVYIPASAENPVIAAFKERGLYKREISPGRHDVTCPWAHEHTDSLDSGAAYFEPSQDYPTGGFRCLHSHGEEIHIGKVIDHLDVTAAQARWRATIRVTSGELGCSVDAAERVLAEQGGYYQSGGVIVQVNNDPIAKDLRITPLTEASLTLALSDACDWERFSAQTKEWSRIDPPERNVRMLLRRQSYKRLPILRGLARQPFYREDGGLVTTPGYDPKSRYLAVFKSGQFPEPDRSEDAARAALDLICDKLLGEFHFAAPIDKAAAVSAIFTAVTRPSLGLAPAFHVRAPSSGTGKSYLCQTIAKFAGPGFSSKVSYPKTSEEATKSVLSLLISAPAVLEFDDMDSDWLPHGPINRMLTSETVTDRILGVSKTATVSTSVLVLGSGNNVGPIRDLSRRVITINLNAKSATPATLSYNGNPVAELTADRELYVSAVLTIIEAWKAAGSPKSNVVSIASYGGVWSDLCRHPLIWLGLPDPAQVLIDQVKTDPDSDVLQRVLEMWYKTFGDQAITVRKLVQDAYDSDLQDALMDLPVAERGAVNRSKLGWYLKRNQDRIIGCYTIQKVDSAERTMWRVVRTEQPNEPPLPPSPSLTGRAEGQPMPEDKF